MNNCQFKFKPDKIKYLSNIDTLDSTHKKTIDTINKKREEVPNKLKRLEKAKSDLELLDRSNPTENDDYIFSRAQIIEEISRLEDEIKQAENYEDEIDYYSKTYDILFNYYDIIDAQNPIEIKHSTNENSNNLNTTSTHVIVDNIPNNNSVNPVKPINIFDLVSPIENVNIDETTDKEILTDSQNTISENNKTESNNNFSVDGIDIFNSKTSKLDLLNQLSKMKRKEKKTTRKRVKNVESLIKDNNNIFDYIEGSKNPGVTIIDNSKNQRYDRASLYEDYKVLIEGYVSKKKNTKPCINCAIDKILIHNEGIYACMKCGEVENCIVESEVTNYKDPMIEKPTFPYKRKNHFCEWMLILNCSLEWILKRSANVNYQFV
jgi:hypothetical protein